MGTNFYFKGNGQHIGKRSAAGLYCFDCDETLCRGGKAHVHDGAYNFYETCPVCGKGREENMHSSAMVELGFEQPVSTMLTGVHTASSFSWAIDPIKFMMEPWHTVVDEYGRTYTRDEFLAMLEYNCPIRFYHSIGRDFS